MPNEQNLIPLDKRTKSEQRKIQSMGGCSSGVSRRRKKSLREAAELYLSLPVADKRTWNRLAREGVEPEDVNNQMAIIAGLALKAMNGDPRAAKVLFDLIGPGEASASDSPVESMTLSEKLAAIREAARTIDH